MWRKPKQEIKAAIRLEPSFVPAYVNLADLFRARGATPKASACCARDSRLRQRAQSFTMRWGWRWCE